MFGAASIGIARTGSWFNPLAQATGILPALQPVKENSAHSSKRNTRPIVPFATEAQPAKGKAGQKPDKHGKGDKKAKK